MSGEKSNRLGGGRALREKGGERLSRGFFSLQGILSFYGNVVEDYNWRGEIKAPVCSGSDLKSVHSSRGDGR